MKIILLKFTYNLKHSFIYFVFEKFEIEFKTFDKIIKNISYRILKIIGERNTNKYEFKLIY